MGVPLNDDQLTPKTLSAVPPAAPPAARKVSISACVLACQAAAAASASCADVCATLDAQNMAGCVRLSLDCAALCRTTGDILTRGAIADRKATRALLKACAMFCAATAAECETYPDNEACRSCAEQCRACEAACIGG
jgi:hypothetical protein